MNPDPGGVADALERLGFETLSVPVLAANGWESHVFRCDTTAGTLAVRVLSADAEIRARREAEIMDAVGKLGYPVPAVHASTTVFDRPALVMDFVDGSTLEQTGWPNRRVAETCVELMRRLHALDSPPDGDPAGWLREGTDRVVERFRRFVPYVEALWAREPSRLSNAYCHLDFHPANVLWDGSPWVIDWTSGRITDPRFDFAWARLLAAMYDPSWLEWLPATEEWFETAMALRRLVTVADMLATGSHAAGDDFADGLGAIQVAADWLEQGTGVPVPDVDALLLG